MVHATRYRSRKEIKYYYGSGIDAREESIHE